MGVTQRAAAAAGFLAYGRCAFSPFSTSQSVVTPRASAIARNSKSCTIRSPFSILLMQSRSYQSTMDMSPSAIYDQLISEYGEKFTKEEAQYAVDNLG